MITIIGAGPAGCYVAYLLAKAGKHVQIFEEHKQAGKPVQCASCVTAKIIDILDFSITKVIVNRIKKVKLFSSNNKLTLQLKKPDLILDREKFDKLIAKKAIEAGVKLKLGYRFLGLNELREIKMLNKKNKKSRIIAKLKNFRSEKIKRVQTDILIGADGPLSLVAGYINKKDKSKRNVIHAVQARVTVPIDEKDCFKIWLNYPKKSKKNKFFTWFIPENNNIARIGLCADSEAKLKLDSLLSRFKNSKGNKGNKLKVLEYQAGLIPLYNKIKVSKGNIYVIGDAACQIKSSTFGGIVPSLMAAKALAKAIINKTNYGKELRSLNKELVTHMKIRKVLNRFSDKDFDLLLKLLDKPSARKILSNITRDAIRKKIIPLFFAQKKLLLFIRKIF